LVAVVTDEAKAVYAACRARRPGEGTRAHRKKLQKARDDLEKTLAKLNNEMFTSKAPENVVAAERERADKAKSLIENLEQSLKALSV
jgi:valyl-tRNA synthetase